MSSSGILGLDSSLILNYYTAQLGTATLGSQSAGSSATSAALSTSTASVNDVTPWSSTTPPSTQIQNAQILNQTSFLNLSNPAITAAATTASQKLEQDNQKLFAIYQGINQLSQLAVMASSDSTPSGELPGLDTRFQAGLQQIEQYIGSTTFNNYNLLPGPKVSSVVSSAEIPQSTNTYVGGVVVKGNALFNPVPNLSTSDSFNIAVKKGGVTTNLAIDLSQVQGPLTLDNIAAYANTQLANAGFSTRLQRVTISDGTDASSTSTSSSSTSTSPSSSSSSSSSSTFVDPITNETFGLQIKSSASETISFSADDAQPAIYLAGSTGTVAAGDQQGRLTKLVNLDGTPQGEFANNITPTSGDATAQSTVVDSQGNVYVLGNTTGSMGGQIEKGSSDTYLTKYDSDGNILWQRLVGASDTAQGYSLALDPTGGVVIAGSTTSDLTQGAIGGGTDAFVAKYTADGSQTWLHQLSPLSNDAALAVSVDSSGNVYVGGDVSGTLAKGQTNNGGATDATVTELDKKGNLVYRQQFGTSGADQVSQVANTADGGLVVASVQNGHAIVAKYANGDATQAPVWQEDLGPLNAGGTIGGIAVDGNNIYISGTTSNTALTAGGQATVVSPSSGGSDAFVAQLTDSGSSATTNYVSYVGTSATDTGGGIAVSDGKVYLTGTTRGAFAGQTQSFANTQNMFAAQLDTDGTVDWTKQFGGVEGTSTGSGIAVDAQGSSALDALGLPRGTISLSQSVNLVDQTTVRAGDSFKMQISNSFGTNTATITIDPDETLSSLADKINTYLGSSGKASVTFKSDGSSALKIAVNAGVQVQLQSGPANSDALQGLGISPGILVNSAKSSSSSSTTPASKQLPVYGLSIPSNLDLLSSTDAKSARAQLLSVLSAVRSAYNTSNTPVSATTSTASSTQSGTTPAYLNNQIANYSLALMLTGGSTSTTA
ncbi:MAG TPA: hypothetical protein VGG10_03890 [Rhizomicrobium sp.]|jgi:hypothetical protein